MSAPPAQDVLDDLTLITEAAREAGAVALSHFGQSPEVWWKNAGQSPVSAADFAANACLEAILRKARPDYGWLSEESGDDFARMDAERTFVVDPIDGTRGFLKGKKNWMVSVAVVSAGRPLAGVLVAPALDETFTGAIGGPALRNGAPITVSANTGDAGSLELCLPAVMLDGFSPPMRARINKAAHIPSLAYRLALVADGRLDATLVRPNSHDWDLAAADVILASAGGALVDESGKALTYNRRELKHGTLFAGHHGLVSALMEEFVAPPMA